MSRLGRNYLEVGRLTETILPMHSVRLIAVNDGVDSANGDDDFTPFRNIINEWYAKDISRKIRSTLRLKSSQGYAVGHPPIGYVHDETDPKKWMIDEEGAEIVKTIFAMRKQRFSVNEIVSKMKRDKILIPSMYAAKKGIRKAAIKVPRNEFLWTHGVVTKILTNQSYVGDVVNFKTFRKFKIKKRFENAIENKEIHKNVHEPIISREDFKEVQKTFQHKTRTPKTVEKNMFSNFLKCSDCGANLNYKTCFGYSGQENHYFACKNYKTKNGLCSKSHHIRADFLNEYVKKSYS